MFFLNFWSPERRPCGEKLKTNPQSLCGVGHADSVCERCDELSSYQKRLLALLACGMIIFQSQKEGKWEEKELCGANIYFLPAPEL